MDDANLSRWSKPYQKLGVKPPRPYPARWYSTSRQDGAPYQYGSRRGARRLAVFLAFFGVATCFSATVVLAVRTSASLALARALPARDGGSID